MTIDDQTTDEIATGTDRRTALKKAAIAAGVVAWTTPVVQAVTARPVHAQGVTGCAPTLTVTAKLTGSGCRCFEAPNSCCDNNTFFITPTFSSCGPTCPGTPVVTGLTITTVLGEKPGCPIQAFQRLACLGNPPTAVVGIKATVTCPDSNVFQINQNVTVDCVVCPGAELGAEDDFLPESLDVTEETQPAVGSPSPEGTLPPEEPPSAPPDEPPSSPTTAPADSPPAGRTDTAGTAPP